MKTRQHAVFQTATRFRFQEGDKTKHAWRVHQREAIAYYAFNASAMDSYDINFAARSRMQALEEALVTMYSNASSSYQISPKPVWGANSASDGGNDNGTASPTRRRDEAATEATNVAYRKRVVKENRSKKRTTDCDPANFRSCSTGVSCRCVKGLHAGSLLNQRHEFTPKVLRAFRVPAGRRAGGLCHESIRPPAFRPTFRTA